MNSYERLMNRLEGKSTDAIPNLNIVMMFAAKQLNIPYKKYVTDYRLLAEGVLHCHENLGLDCLCVISDPMREAEGFGATTILPENGVPYCKDPYVKTITDIGSLKPIDPSLGRRMNGMTA